MNQSEAPKDDREVQDLFRTEDDLGANSSLFLRAIRQLTAEGKPLGQITMVTIPTGNDKSMPIALLTFTKKNRLVVWPTLPRKKVEIIGTQARPMPDHFTVEFPGDKVHATNYAIDGESNHFTNSWRSSPVLGSEFRMLFMFLVRIRIIIDRDVLISRKFVVREKNSDRVTAEFSRFRQNLLVYQLPVQSNPPESDYACFGIFRAPGMMTGETLPPSLLPDRLMDDVVEGWPSNAEFPLSVGQFQVGENWFCLAAGFPPGILREELCFGLPNRTPVKQR